MDTEREIILEKVDRHLERWRGFLIKPALPNNHALAEQAIGDLYALLKKEQPTVLWCDSPFQMGVIPPMVTNIVQSTEWAILNEHMKAYENPGSAEWEKLWQHEWDKLSPLIEKLDRKLIGSDNILRVDESVRNVARRRTKEIMRQILVENRLAPGKHFPTNHSARPKQSDDLLRTPLHMEFCKSLLLLHSKIEQIAGLKLTSNILFVANMMFGNWDPRLLYQLLPATESIASPQKLSPDVSALIAEIRQKCVELEMTSARFILWYLNLPSRRPIETAPSLGTNNLFLDGLEIFNQTRDRRADYTHHFTIWFPYSANYLPFALACQFISADFFGELQKEIDIWAYLAHAAGGYYFCDSICFACTKPFAFTNNDIGRPHNASGPAAVWNDGFRVYAWRGVVVDPSFIENKSSITCEKIGAEKNAEMRRVMIDIYGESRYLQDAGAELVFQDKYGALYRLEIPGDEPIVMVKVKNSTPEPDGSYKNYFLRVPPEMVRPRQAIAWTFGLNESEYCPEFES